MKRLYILRHSKAGQTNKSVLDDHERTLTEKGTVLCAPVGRYIKNLEFLPEKIISSTAIRARETAELVSEVFDHTFESELVSRLYLAGTEDILSVVRNIDDSVSSVLIVGHNPSLHQFCIMLSGKGDKKKFREMRSNFPPPSLVVFDISCENWQDIGIQSGELVDFVMGKNLYN